MGSKGEFPAGVRVLVVDHDSTPNLEKLLKKFKYQVWRCNLGRGAMDMLGEKNEKYNFEIVISDVNMKDMDGFEFVQHVAHKLEVPVIMMSGNGERGQIMRGIGSGACAYLPKPIQPRDAQFIWQHVYRTRMARAGKNNNKREELVIKKPRVIWTPELHQSFENAVDQIRRNNNRVGPKRILELMGDTSLTREQIASHLQKYRSKSEREEEAASMMIDGAAPNGNSYYHQQQLLVDPHPLPLPHMMIQQALNTNTRDHTFILQHNPPLNYNFQPH